MGDNENYLGDNCFLQGINFRSVFHGVDAPKIVENSFWDVAHVFPVLTYRISPKKS